MEVLNGRVTTLLLIRLTRIQVGGQKVGCILGRSSVHCRQNTHLRVHVRLISKPAKHVFAAGRKLLQQQGGHANCTQKGPTQPGGSHGDRRDDSVNHTIIRLLHN